MGLPPFRDLPPPDNLPPPPAPPVDNTTPINERPKAPRKPLPTPPLKKQAENKDKNKEASHLTRTSPPRQMSSEGEASRKLIAGAEKIDKTVEKPKGSGENPRPAPLIGRRMVPTSADATPAANLPNNVAGFIGIAKKNPPLRPAKANFEDERNSRGSASDKSRGPPLSSPSYAPDLLAELKEKTKATSRDRPAMGIHQSGEHSNLLYIQEHLPYTVLFITRIAFKESPDGKAAFESPQVEEVYKKVLADFYMIFEKGYYPVNLREFTVINENLERVENIIRKTDPKNLQKFETLKEEYLRKALIYAKAIPIEKTPLPCRITNNSMLVDYTTNMLYLMAMDQAGLIRLPVNPDRSIPEKEHKARLGIVSPDELVLGYKSLGISSTVLLHAIAGVLEIDDSKLKNSILNFLMKWMMSGLYKNDIREPTSVNTLEAILDMNFYCKANDPLILDYKPKLEAAFLKNAPALPSWKPSPVVKEPKPITDVYASGIGAISPLNKAHVELAKEVTALTLDLIAKFPPSELIDADKKILTPNMSLSIEQMQNFSKAIIKQIVQSPNLGKAKDIFDFYVNVMSECLKQGNVQGAFIIYQGLNDAAVSRLKFKNRAFDEAQVLFSAKNNFANLREHYKTYPKGSIPCLEVLTKDILFAKDGSADVINGKLNVQRLLGVTSLIGDFYKKVIEYTINHPETEHTVDLMDTLESKEDLKTLYDASLVLKPREPSAK